MQPARPYKSSCLSLILEDHVTDRRIRRGHVVEALDTANALVKRAAHDEPHHELDALRTRFTQVLHGPNRCRLLWRFDHEVHEAVVEFPVRECRCIREVRASWYLA